MASAGMPWIRVDVDAEDEPRCKDFCEHVNDPNGYIYIDRLWRFVGKWHPTGVLTVSARRIEDAIRWHGEAGAGVEALLARGLLTGKEGAYEATGWAEQNGAAHRKISSDRERRRAVREPPTPPAKPQERPVVPAPQAGPRKLPLPTDIALVWDAYAATYGPLAGGLAECDIPRQDAIRRAIGFVGNAERVRDSVLGWQWDDWRMGRRPGDPGLKLALRQLLQNADLVEQGLQLFTACKGTPVPPARIPIDRRTLRAPESRGRPVSSDQVVGARIGIRGSREAIIKPPEASQ